jgi:hypothetical protein
MALFTLTIEQRTANFGETPDQLRQAVARTLQKAAIGSGAQPTDGHSLAEPGGLHPDNVTWKLDTQSANPKDRS